MIQTPPNPFSFPHCWILFKGGPDTGISITGSLCCTNVRQIMALEEGEMSSLFFLFTMRDIVTIAAIYLKLEAEES